MINSYWVVAIAAAAVVSALLSWLISTLARAIVMRRVSEDERRHLLEIEKTVRELAELRRLQVVPKERLERLLERVVNASLTEARGKRLLGDLKDVDVQGGDGIKRALLNSAERALHARFTREFSHPV